MEIEKVKELKIEIENFIYDKIQEFEARTGTRVIGTDLTFAQKVGSERELMTFSLNVEI